jgi:hypothetical protein
VLGEQAEILDGPGAVRREELDPDRPLVRLEIGMQAPGASGSRRDLWIWGAGRRGRVASRHNEDDLSQAKLEDGETEDARRHNI